jgi:hypothetical protein
MQAVIGLCRYESLMVYDPNIHKMLEKKGPPDFAFKKLLSFDHTIYLDQSSNRIKAGTVPLSAVVGTTHGDYAGCSWLELLPTDYRLYSEEDYRNRTLSGLQGRLKRGWERLKELHSNPDYYLSCTPKAHLSFCKVGKNYYIADGNHRVVLARFFLSLNGLTEKLQGVNVTEYLL